MNPVDQHAKRTVANRLIGLAYGYQTHQSAFEIALNPDVLDYVRRHRNVINDIGEIPRLNDKGWQYSKIAWLENRDFRATLEDDFSSAWLSGALITAGDLLARHYYFSRHPMLEMIRHLRNAVAHGNVFRIDSKAKLHDFPANNQGAKFRGWDKTSSFEITPDLHGRKFMFEYMAPGDILDIIASCGFLLLEQANACHADA